MKKYVYVVVLILFSLVLMVGCPGSPAQLGDGTLGNPYLVSNAQELWDVRENLYAHYRQVADIDLASFNDGQWVPIGYDVDDPSEPGTFMGTYDGGGYTISNLRVTNMRGGLFDQLQAVDSVVLKNISLEDVIISCDSDVVGSGIIAYYNSGDLENCSVEGSITAALTENIGGLVGILNANVENCAADVDLTGVRNIGGIAGQVQSPMEIINSFATGNLVASGTEYGSYTGVSLVGVKPFLLPSVQAIL